MPDYDPHTDWGLDWQALMWLRMDIQMGNFHHIHNH